MLNNSPKTIAELKHKPHVIDGNTLKTPFEAAKEFFGSESPVTEGEATKLRVSHIFTEGNIDVYECYFRPGDIDYLYIKQTRI